MKRAVQLLLTVSLALTSTTTIAKAQGCISFTPDFSIYATESTDGTYVYTSVLFDGTGDMTITDPGSPSCPPGTPVHTAYVQNIVGSVGGWSPGESGCPDCYFSITNNQQADVPPSGEDLDFDYDTMVVCSVAGTFWGSGGSLNLKFGTAIANYLFSHSAPNVCYYNLYCTGGTKASCPQESGQLVKPTQGKCWTGNAQTEDLWVSPDGGKTKYCSPFGAVTTSVDPVPCS